jgi:hypothetical protein
MLNGTRTWTDSFDILVVIPKSIRLLRRTKRRWRDNIKTNFKKNTVGVDRIHMVLNEDQWRNLVSVLMNILVP